MAHDGIQYMKTKYGGFEKELDQQDENVGVILTQQPTNGRI